MMNTQTTAQRMTSTRIRSVVTAALFIALTFLATMFIHIQLFPAAGGLVHLGNVPLFIAAILFGKKQGAVAGAVGMALFDLTSGWSPWAPFTFVIVGLIGFAVGAIMENKEKHFYAWYALAMLAALVIKIGGYYVAEALIFGNWAAPVTSIPGNLVQIGVAAVATLPLIAALRRILGAQGGTAA